MMLKAIVLVALLLAGDPVRCLAKCEQQTEMADFTSYVTGHTGLGSLLNTIVQLIGKGINAGMTISEASGLKKECYYGDRKDRKCFGCTTYLYKDNRFGHGQDKTRVKAKFEGQVYENRWNQDRCFVPDAVKMGAEPYTSTFIWDHGKWSH